MICRWLIIRCYLLNNVWVEQPFVVFKSIHMNSRPSNIKSLCFCVIQPYDLSMIKDAHQRSSAIHIPQSLYLELPQCPLWVGNLLSREKNVYASGRSFQRPQEAIWGKGSLPMGHGQIRLNTNTRGSRFAPRYMAVSCLIQGTSSGYDDTAGPLLCSPERHGSFEPTTCASAELSSCVYPQPSRLNNYAPCSR